MKEPGDRHLRPHSLLDAVANEGLGNTVIVAATEGEIQFPTQCRVDIALGRCELNLRGAIRRHL